MNTEELERLIDALLDGDISEADFLRLEAELSVNPGARASYYSRLKLDTLLEGDAENLAAGEKVVTVPRREFRWGRFAALAAAVVAVGTSALVGFSVGKRPASAGSATPADSEPAASGFGVIAEQADAVWQSDHRPARGDLVPGGGLQLASGTVKLDLFSGVTVIVEGAAEFELVSAMEMRVQRGKIRALVPEQASGFRIRTANGELVDLGTEFSMEITPEHADLHVLDGEIEWHPNSDDARRLTEGQAIRWARDGRTTSLELDGQRIADIERAFDERRAERHQAWLQHVSEHANEPRLVAYFPFQQARAGRHTLSDQSGAPRDAAIIRCLPAPNRWGEAKAALDFSPTGSRVGLDIDGSYRSISLVCWVKIDSLDRWYNSLFLTDGHELGEPHWQIMDDGRLFFSVKKHEKGSKARPDKHVFYSPPIWNPSMSGRWLQIATVYDVDAKQVTHFLNGEVVSSEAVPEGYLVEQVKIGRASIGNWAEPKFRTDPHFVMRNLNGSIDEFAIYSTALSPDEVRGLYETGKP